MRDRFEEQLKLLNKELVEMGALCEESIAYAVKFLTERDEKMRQNAIEAEKQIDHMEKDIESLCMRLLIEQQPVASDFRKVTSALKMISDLERIGDHAEDIAEIAVYVDPVDLKNQVHINDMAQAAVRMVVSGMDSYVKQDEELARSVLKMDDTVDKMFLSVKNELIEMIRSGEENGETLLDLLMIAKYFERIGDHAENIAEWVIYAVTGKHRSEI